MERQLSRGHRQQGAALYVALIMLILLALLGLAGMQVSSMQERMASNYRSVDLAFQNAEASVRATEAAIKAQGAAYSVDSTQCAFDSLAWARAQTAANAVYVRRLVCETTTGSSSNLGGITTSGTGSGVSGSAYEITALANDVGTTSSAVVQTIYIP